VKVWDSQTGQELLGLKPRVGFPYSRLVFSPDGKRLAASGMTVWDAETGNGLHFKDGGQNMTFSPDGKRQVGLSRDGMVKVWDAQTRQELLAFTPGRTTGWLLSLAFSPDGKRLAGAALDGTVTVWDAQTGQEMLTFEHAVTIGSPTAPKPTPSPSAPTATS
jgi:WD40 repeat protein